MPQRTPGNRKPALSSFSFKSVLRNSTKCISHGKMNTARSCAKLCGELRAEVPEQLAQRDPEELLIAVREAVAKATGYGIVGGDGIRRFVKLAVLVDPRFDELPAVQGFLGLADLDPDLKIKLLSDLAAVELRNRAV